MKSQSSQRSLFVCVAIAVATFALYWPMRHHDFVIYDDEIYVTKNPIVQAGITAEGLNWAFFRVAGEGTYWHPVTWISHMIDCQVFGLKPGAHHLVSLVFHIANALLFFALLNRLTKAFWPSATAAALFAVNPLNVETVAWVAERKNVLSTLFLLVTSLFYVRYVEELKLRSSKSKIFYGLVLLFFAIGLMCKPMLVTLPFIFLLLDFWPLKRMGASGWQLTRSDLRLVLEKIPMFALAVVSSVITILAHKKLDLLQPDVPQFSFISRIGNAFVSYVRYVEKLFWPTDLSVYYPLPSAWPGSFVMGAALLILAISAAVFVYARKKPFIFVGWLWFLGSLVPVIGIVQANDQAMANRFIYVPMMGLLILICWGGAELIRKFSIPRSVVSVAVVFIFCASIAASSHHLKHWRNSEELFKYATKVTERNNVAWLNLGVTYANQNRLEEALSAYRQSISIQPTNAMVHSNLGVVLGRMGRLDEAIECFKESLEINPDNADAHSNFGMALMQKGQNDEAIPHLLAALRCKPDHADGHFNLANVLAQKGQLDEAEVHYRAALKVRPNNPDLRNNFGRVLLLKHQTADAVEQFEMALRINPDHAQAHFNLARAFVSQGRQAEAAPHLEALSRLNPALLQTFNSEQAQRVTSPR